VPTLAERYELGGLLGSGGSASVFRARDLAQARDVAVKVIPFEPCLTNGEEPASADVERFRREALLLSRLRSRHVARVYDFGSDPDVGLFLVMELIEGSPLEARSFGRPLLPHEVLRVARGVLDALADAHASGLVHRDIKPSNVVVPRTPRALDEVRVLDFGIARSMRRAEIDAALGHAENGRGRVFGTPAYMAPEQLEDGEVGPRADLYAAGLMLYELLGAGPLFPGHTLREQLGARLRGDPRLDGRVPPPLGTLLAGMLRREPGGRFANGAEALEAILDLDTAPVSVEELSLDRRAEETRPPDGEAPLLGERSPSARMRAAEAAPSSPSSPPPRPSSLPARPSSKPPPSGVAFGGRRACRLDADPLRALRETLHALDIPLLEALARRERGSELGRVARSLALAMRLELDAAAVLLDPLAASALARAFGATFVASRARRVTRARVEHDRTDVWIDAVEPELAAMLAAVAAAMTTMGDASRNEVRCRRAAARLHELAPEARTARMGMLLCATICGSLSTSSALIEMLRLRDNDPAPPTPFTTLLRALLLGVVAFRGDEHLAREQLERAAKLAAESGATLFEVRAIVAWGGMLVEIPSRIEQGLGVLERATTLLAHGDAPSLEHIAEHNRGAALLIQRRYVESAEHLHRARLAARGELSSEHEMVSCTNEAFAHTFVGAYELATQAVAELTDAQVGQVSARTAAFAHVARSLYALVFQGLDRASAELRRALARVEEAEANGGDVALLAELLSILYASARGEPVDLLPRAAELEKLAEQHGFASLYWMENLRNAVSQVRERPVREAMEKTLERLFVMLGPVNQVALGR
jgi:serine/threonine protein kinase